MRDKQLIHVHIMYKDVDNRYCIYRTVAGEFTLTTHGSMASPPFCAMTRVLFLVLN